MCGCHKKHDARRNNIPEPKKRAFTVASRGISDDIKTPENKDKYMI